MSLSWQRSPAGNPKIRNQLHIPGYEIHEAQSWEFKGDVVGTGMDNPFSQLSICLLTVIYPPY